MAIIINNVRGFANIKEDSLEFADSADSSALCSIDFSADGQPISISGLAAAVHSHQFAGVSGVAAAVYSHQFADVSGVAAASHTHQALEVSGVAFLNHLHNLSELPEGLTLTNFRYAGDGQNTLKGFQIPSYCRARLS